MGLELLNSPVTQSGAIITSQLTIFSPDRLALLLVLLLTFFWSFLFLQLNLIFTTTKGKKEERIGVSF